MGFLKAGILGFGGGMACLPLIEKEAVDKYQWVDKAEFGEIVAISNTLPGPINTKMAGYIGYRCSGTLGAAIAVCATVLPSVAALILLLGTITRFRTYPVVAGMLGAIVPVVAVMLGLMAWQFLSAAGKEMKWKFVIMHIAIVSALVLFLSIHPAIVVAGLISLALVMPVKKNKKSEDSK